MNLLKQIEFKIKEGFFFVFQLFLKKGKSDYIIPDSNKFQKILILRPDRIGDTVCTFPLIDSLKENFPQMKISIFASSKNYSLIKNDPRFDKIFIYRRNILRDIKEVMAVRDEKYDCVVDLLADDSVTTLFLSQFCSVYSKRIGLGKKKFEKYYDFNYTPEPDCKKHTVDINLKLLDAFGSSCTIAERHAPPFVDDTTSNNIDEFLNSISNNNPNGIFVGLNLSARGENRNWGEKKSTELISRIIETSNNCNVILITAPNERFKGDAIEKQFDKNVVQIPPNSNLTEASALISKLDILISPDTSLVHIGRSFKIPVIGLYTAYKKVYRQWRPFNQEDGLVLSYGDDNIFNISVEQVFDEFEKMKQKKQSVKN
ncbi:MAG: glycosyltransferase family 9 protein [candidate division Zixibacteria bacterium]|nr:glycosyltransferase family 9 protein [candidate division Zixibacteria bacterium]